MTQAFDADVLRAALLRVADPVSGKILADLGFLDAVETAGGRVSVVLAVPPGPPQQWEPLRQACEVVAESLSRPKPVAVILTAHREPVRPARPPAGQKSASQPPAPPARAPLPGIAHVIAVASGKGGVGKSTVAVNLAVAMARLGKRVGLLDADIYGPSAPMLLGLSGKPQTAGGKLLPKPAFGISVMSFGFFVDVDTPAIWRGPMAAGALTQMLTDVDWGTLDVLVVDMPPGTGDVQLTMAQRVPLSGAVIVSTPQDLALIDARKAIAMFRKTEVPILGLVENMSSYVCPQCGHEAHIFGHGGAHAVAERLGCPVLGDVPLDLGLRVASDAGEPVAAGDLSGPIAARFANIARAALEALQMGAGARPAPRIVMQ